jgi:hypothetical protein
MNISSRVPGITRNSGWDAVDAEIRDRRARKQENETAYLQARKDDQPREGTRAN